MKRHNRNRKRPRESGQVNDFAIILPPLECVMWLTGDCSRPARHARSELGRALAIGALEGAHECSTAFAV